MTVKTILDLLTSTTFTALVNVASAIGFVVTILVYLDVRRIKRYYAFVGRAPDLVKSLKQHSSNLSEYLNDFEDFAPQIQEELTRTEVVLKSLEKKTDGQLKQSVSQLLKAVRNFDLNSKDKDALRLIYLGLIRVHAEIADTRRDQLWEIRS